MPTTTAALGLVITAVMIWYVAEWRHCQEKRQPMNLVRNPLALFWLALRRLWRNRRFVGILICCWLFSVGVHWFILYPLVVGPQLERLREAAAEQGIDLDDPAFSREGVSVDIGSGGPLGKGPKYWLWRSLPQFRTVSLELPNSAWMIIEMLALGIFAAVLIKLWFRRPEWLLPEVHHRLIWPIHLGLGGFLLMAAETALLCASALTRDPLALSVSAASQVFWLIAPLLVIFATAVLSAFLWHIVLQVGNGQHGNLYNAVTAAINNWLPIAWLTVLVWVPYTLLMGLTMLVFRGTISETMVDIVSTASNIAWTIPTLVRIALLFVPWIILAEGTNLLPAIRRNLLLIRSQWQDLLVMLPRYLLIVVPAYALLGAAGWPASYSSGAGTLVTLGCSIIELVLLVAIVVLYLELRKGENAQPELQEVA